MIAILKYARTSHKDSLIQKENVQRISFDHTISFFFLQEQYAVCGVVVVEWEKSSTIYLSFYAFFHPCV